MRIPVPERFRLKSVIVFVTVLVVAQHFEGTDTTFSLLTAIYTCLFAWAFNLGGGLYFLAGAYVFFNGLLSALLAITYKCFLGEPGNSNLVNPNRTLLAFCLGMLGLVVAAAFSRRFVPSRGLLANLVPGNSMKQAAIGCLLLGVFLQVATAAGSHSTTATFSSAIGQLNHFVQMAIILGTTYEINASQGKRSSNWIVWCAAGWNFFFGVIVFSKEGMFGPIVSWFIPAVVLGFNFSKKQLVIGALGIFFLLHYLVPFSQYGRIYRSESGGANTAAALALLRHPEGTRQLYLEQQDTQQGDGGPHFYDTPQGLFDREEMLSVDDALITWTDQGNVIGIGPTVAAFENIVPRFIWKNKPNVEGGNGYAREMGMLPDDDDTTGIAFSPVGDGYHQASWFGVLVLFPFVAFLLFLIGDTVCGDTRKSPWGLLLIALSSHIAPEGLIEGAVYLLSYGVFAVSITALLARYVLPIISNVLTGSERTRVRRTLQFTPASRGARINPILRTPLNHPDITPPNP